MLSSTRATARTLAARATSSFAQAPPAESSRQGLLRAIAQQQLAEQRRTLHHRRRHGSTYSTAAVLAEDDRQERLDDAAFRRWDLGRSDSEAAVYRPPSRPPNPTTFTNRHEEESFEGVRTLTDDDGRIGKRRIEGEIPTIPALVDLIETDPLQALHHLPRYPPSQLDQLSARHLNNLLKNIYSISRGTSTHREDFPGPLDGQRQLYTLRNLLRNLPSSSTANDRGMGNRFRRDLLSRFMRACAILDCDDLLADTLRERLAAQRKSGEIIVQPDMLATELAVHRRWHPLIKLLSPSAFPVSSYTPYTIQRLIQAHLVLGRAYQVPTLFRLYADLDLPPPPRAYSLLVESYLVLGDIAAARQVMRGAFTERLADEVAHRLSILRGHRSLGKDEELERKSLEFADGLEPAHRAALLHALIRLRIDAGDRPGALDLLGNFRLDGPWRSTAIDSDSMDSMENVLEPNEQTFLLAFCVMAPDMSMEELEAAWPDLARMSNADQLVTVLVDTLGNLGRLDLARSLFAKEASTGVFAPPVHFRPTVIHLNKLLGHACRLRGFAGLEDTLKLFRSLEIKPDERTLEIVLDFVRRSTVSDPAPLANMLNAMLRQSPSLKPTVDHVNLLMTQAVRARSRSAHLAARSGESESTASFLDTPAEMESTNPQAGLRPNEPFRIAMKGIIQSLHARGARSVSQSLATRLRFDAQSGASVPSAQKVWDDMLSRGYQPDKRHLLALMKGYAESGQSQECEDVILLAKDSGVAVTRGMWMVIMTAYGKKGNLDLERAERAFDAIRRSEQGPDPAAVCAMIGIYLRSRRRHLASHLALQLVGNLVSPNMAGADAGAVPDKHSSEAEEFTTIPHFARDELDERVIAIATDALRLDHPRCALEVINTAFPTHLPTRVRQVVKSIRSRSRARLGWNVANSLDPELLSRAEEMLSADNRGADVRLATAGEAIIKRPLGPKGVKKRILRLFERRRHGRRGSGGRKVISAKEERRVRHETIQAGKQQTPE